MFKIICVTDPSSCRRDFMTQLGEIAQAGTDRIILRNKGISEQEYKVWAGEIKDRLEKFTICTVHHYWETARNLQVSDIHVSFYQLQENPEIRECAGTLGVSVHSVKQAVRAWKMGADYLIAGHIYETACKEGLPGRGLSFLKQICGAVSVPVYAIGGIGLADYDKIEEIIRAKAGGICIMSDFMNSKDPRGEVKRLRKYLENRLY